MGGGTRSLRLNCPRRKVIHALPYSAEEKNTRTATDFSMAWSSVLRYLHQTDNTYGILSSTETTSSNNVASLCVYTCQLIYSRLITYEFEASICPHLIKCRLIKVGSPVSLRKLLFAYTCTRPVRATIDPAEWMASLARCTCTCFSGPRSACVSGKSMFCVLMPKKYSHAPLNDVSVDGRHMIIVL